MNPYKPESDWEAHLDRQLRELPDRPAPTTLMPRVLAAIRARALPWYQRTWGPGRTACRSFPWC